MLKREEISRKLNEVNQEIEKLLPKQPLGIDTPRGTDLKEYEKLIQKQKMLIEELKKF